MRSPKPPAHPWHVSRVEMPVAARAPARPSRLVKFGPHRPTRAHRRTIHSKVPMLVAQAGLIRYYFTAAKSTGLAVPTHASDAVPSNAFARFRQSHLGCAVPCARRRDPCNPISLAWRCFKLARHSHTYGMAPRRPGHVLAAVFRSCAYRPSSYVPLPYQGCPGRICMAVRSTLP